MTARPATPPDRDVPIAALRPPAPPTARLPPGPDALIDARPPGHTDARPDARPPGRTAARTLRVAIGLVLLLLAAFGVAVARLWPDRIAALMAQAGAIEARLGAAGWVIASIGQVVIALCGVLPASVGALSAGALYGVAGGFLVSGIGTLVGAALAFGLARSLLRPLIASWLGRRARLGRLDEAVSAEGWRIVCLLRMSPIMPFAVTSYALGLTSLRFRDYWLGTLASLPALFFYVLLGHIARSGLATLADHRARPLHGLLLAIAAGATLLLTLRLGRIVRRAIRVPPQAERALDDALGPDLDLDPPSAPPTPLAQHPTGTVPRPLR